MENRIDVNTKKTIDNDKAVLKEYFSKYLLDVRKLKKSTVNHYLDALNNISKRLQKEGLVKKDIYEIGDLQQLFEVKDFLFTNLDFIESNKRGHQMYSTGLNNYCKFASGEKFQEIKDKVQLLDMPVEPSDATIIEHNTWKRSGIIRNQVIELANYSCEINSEHQSFIAEKNKKPYMEGHHAIPMKLQSRFDKSLDVYANIICLCPLCHRRIHYGVKKDRQQMMRQIYEDRAERLVSSGIKLSKQEFTELVVNE